MYEKYPQMEHPCIPESINKNTLENVWKYPQIEHPCIPESIIRTL